MMLTHYSHLGTLVSVIIQCDWSHSDYMSLFSTQHHWKESQDCLQIETKKKKNINDKEKEIQF